MRYFYIKADFAIAVRNATAAFQMLMFFWLASASAQAAEFDHPGCESEGNYKIARFHRDCLHEASSGYFNIPDKYKVYCTIGGESFFAAMPRYSGPKLKIDIPVATLLPAVPEQKSTISIAISANEENTQHTGCAVAQAGKGYNSYLKYLADNNLEYEKTVELTPHRIEIVGLHSKGSHFTSHIYVGTDPDNRVTNIATCRDDAPVCSGDGAPIQAGLYQYRVTIPQSYSKQSFEIMDAVSKLVESSYVSDSKK